jgi:hypothetical protein
MQSLYKLEQNNTSVRWIVSGWPILICYERKILLNDWLILADKNQANRLNVSKYESLILYDKLTSYISVSKYSVQSNPQDN